MRATHLACPGAFAGHFATHHKDDTLAFMNYTSQQF